MGCPTLPPDTMDAGCICDPGVGVGLGRALHFDSSGGSCVDDVVTSHPSPPRLTSHQPASLSTYSLLITSLLPPVPDPLLRLRLSPLDVSSEVDSAFPDFPPPLVPSLLSPQPKLNPIEEPRGMWSSGCCARNSARASRSRAPSVHASAAFR